MKMKGLAQLEKKRAKGGPHHLAVIAPKTTMRRKAMEGILAVAMDVLVAVILLVQNAKVTVIVVMMTLKVSWRETTLWAVTRD
jgi:hypothetical protein